MCSFAYSPFIFFPTFTDYLPCSFKFILLEPKLSLLCANATYAKYWEIFKKTYRLQSYNFTTTVYLFSFSPRVTYMYMYSHVTILCGNHWSLIPRHAVFSFTQKLKENSVMQRLKIKWNSITLRYHLNILVTMIHIFPLCTNTYNFICIGYCLNCSDISKIIPVIFEDTVNTNISRNQILLSSV